MRLICFLFIIMGLSHCNTAKQERAYVPAKNGPVNIAYDIKGSNDTVVIFVHGWAINKTYWKNQVDTFSKRFTVVALDLGGHGQSNKNRNSYTVDDYAADIIAVMDALKADKVILVGHSMSGDIIANVANKVPKRIIGLIGVDNFKSITTSYNREDSLGIDSFKINLNENYKDVVAEWCYKGLFPPGYKDSSIMKQLVTDVLKTDTVVSIKTIESMIASELSAGERLSKLTIPVHVITSDYAPVNKATMKQYAKAGFKEKIITGTGHYPMVEKPAEFNRLLWEFIDDIAAGK